MSLQLTSTMRTAFLCESVTVDCWKDYALYVVQGWGRLQKPDYDYDYSAHKIIDYNYDYDYSGDWKGDYDYNHPITITITITVTCLPWKRF